MNAIAEAQVRRLAQVLSTVSQPLVPLLECADDLEKRLGDHDEVGIACIAALLRARAGTVRQEMADSLKTLEEAARRVADG